MFVTNWISTIKIQKISEITNFFRHYFLSRTEVIFKLFIYHCQENPKVFSLWDELAQDLALFLNVLSELHHI